MRLGEPVQQGWQACLSLGFERRGEGTVLVRREHHGPLRVQKSLHPEGPGVCHAIVLHPPSGIAGGDELEIRVNVDAHAHALLTTPGATKWYRSTGAWATQHLAFQVGPGALLEWLPQPGIAFSGTLARMTTQIQLAPGATYLGWETLCLGRKASGERFDLGSLQLATRIADAGGSLWLERGRIEGGADLLASPVGLAGRSLCATLLAAGHDIDDALLSACRGVAAAETAALCGVTRLPRLLVARYLGDSAESAQNWLMDLWQRLRPALCGREAQRPRIWST